MTQATIVLDFDGTLHDIMGAYAPAVRSVYGRLEQQGAVPLHEFTEAELKSFIGITPERMWEQAAPGLAPELVEESIALVGESMDRELAGGRGKLFPGVPEALDVLKRAGHRLVFLSNCHADYQERVREAFGLDQWFCAYFNAEEHPGMSKSEIFREAIGPAFSGPYIGVGDRGGELAMARENGFPFIGCAYGYAAPGELDAADAIAAAPDDIPGLVELILSRM